MLLEYYWKINSPIIIRLMITDAAAAIAYFIYSKLNIMYYRVCSVNMTETESLRFFVVLIFTNIFVFDDQDSYKQFLY